MLMLMLMSVVDSNILKLSLVFFFLQLHSVDDNVGKSRRILNSMSRRMSRNKWIMGSIIGVLILAIIVVIYVKVSR